MQSFKEKLYKLNEEGFIQQMPEESPASTSETKREDFIMSSRLKTVSPVMSAQSVGSALSPCLPCLSYRILQLLELVLTPTYILGKWLEIERR